MGRVAEQRLTPMLRRAAGTAPHYRSWWGPAPGASVENLAGWPILEKDAARENPASLLVKGVERRRMYPMHTSWNNRNAPALLVVTQRRPRLVRVE